MRWHSYEDLRQEARVAIWEAAERYDAERGTHLRSWCMLRALGHLRSMAALERRRTYIDVLPEHRIEPAWHADTCELDQAILKLPPMQRSVISYMFVGGLTVREVAGIMRRSVGIVHRDRELALAALRDILAPQVEHLMARAG